MVQISKSLTKPKIFLGNSNKGSCKNPFLEKVSWQKVCVWQYVKVMKIGVVRSRMSLFRKEKFDVLFRSKFSVFAVVNK